MNTVQFPGLGIDLTINRVAFTIFGLPIYWYGIILAFGFLLAVLLAVRQSKKFDIVPDHILDMVLFAAPIAIITARLYYVIFSWDLFKDNPIDMINTRKGGLAIYGAVIGAVATAFIFARVKKISFLKLVDFCAPFLILAQAIGRWGNFVNQEAYGSQTTLPWRMNGTVPDEYLKSLGQNLDLSKWGVHPTFLYESLWCLLVFFFLLWFRHRKKFNGEVISLYFILYGIERFFVEQLRTDSLLIGNEVRVSEYLSAALVVVLLIVFIYRRARGARVAEELAGESVESEYSSVLAKLRESEATENEEAGNETAESGMVGDEIVEAGDEEKMEAPEEDAAPEMPEGQAGETADVPEEPAAKEPEDDSGEQRE